MGKACQKLDKQILAGDAFRQGLKINANNKIMKEGLALAEKCSFFKSLQRLVNLETRIENTLKRKHDEAFTE
jgi:hypothetical protein